MHLFRLSTKNQNGSNQHLSRNPPVQSGSFAWNVVEDVVSYCVAQPTTNMDQTEHVNEITQTHPIPNFEPADLGYGESAKRSKKQDEKEAKKQEDEERRKKIQEKLRVQDYAERRKKFDEVANSYQSQLVVPSVGSSSQIQVSANGDKSTMSRGIQKLVLVEKPNVRWDDVIGHDHAKGALHNAVVMPLTQPHLFQNNRVKPIKNILLSGPPGCGKTELARAVATEAERYTFFHVSSSDVFSKYVGDPEKKVAELFEAAEQSKPAIIFIDEIDAICRSRGDEQADVSRRVLTEILSRLDGISSRSDSGIVFIAATNVPWDLDEAMLRRFQVMVYAALPDAVARKKLFQLHLGKIPNTLTEEDFKTLGDNTHGFSGSDIKAIADVATGGSLQKTRASRYFKEANDGFFYACDENEPGAVPMSFDEVPYDRLELHPVTFEDVKNVVLGRKPSVSTTLLDKLDKFHENHGH